VTQPATNSLVIPVYKNEGSLPDLMAACRQLASALSGDLEVVLVVDGSPDGCFAWLDQHLPEQPFTSQLVLHSRNFGSFAAIRTGLATARGQRFAVMAADLQEPISLAQAFFSSLVNDEADVVIGVRGGRNDPIVSSLASRIFWGLYRRLIFPEIPPGGVDMFGCNAKVRDQLLALHERNSSLVAQLFWVGFRRKQVSYERQVRQHGTSAWTFSKKVRYLLDSVYSFSDLPIRVLKWVGGLSVALATVLSVVVLAARLAGLIEVAGYTPIILSVTFFGGLNAFGLGLVGEYIWRTFENSKARPLAITTVSRSFTPTRRP
jgi:polyisoprenyl-phosphate glycosyltransferase